MNVFSCFCPVKPPVQQPPVFINDVLRLIIRLLDPKSLAQAAAVCRQWERVALEKAADLYPLNSVPTKLSPLLSAPNPNIGLECLGASINILDINVLNRDADLQRMGVGFSYHAKLTFTKGWVVVKGNSSPDDKQKLQILWILKFLRHHKIVPTSGLASTFLNNWQHMRMHYFERP